MSNIKANTHGNTHLVSKCCAQQLGHFWRFRLNGHDIRFCVARKVQKIAALQQKVNAFNVAKVDIRCVQRLAFTWPSCAQRISTFAATLQFFGWDRKIARNSNADWLLRATLRHLHSHGSAFWPSVASNFFNFSRNTETDIATVQTRAPKVSKCCAHQMGVLVCISLEVHI